MKNFIVLFLALVGLSWGACVSYVGSTRVGYTCYGITNSGVVGDVSKCGWGQGYPVVNKFGVATDGPYCSGSSAICYGYYCNTQAEADSVNCVNAGSNWSNGTCTNCTEPDSVWGACATMYKYDIQTGRNEPITQVRKYKRANCEVSETSREEYRGRTCDDVLTPDSSQVKCYATIDNSTVYLQNGAGKVWACPNSDGSCEVAQKNYILGKCPPPESENSSPESSSGSENPPESSSEAGENPGGSSDSEEQPPEMGLDWLKDSMYMVDTNFRHVRGQLDGIGADLNHTARTTDDLLSNSYTQNQLLRDLVNKDFSTNVNVKGDTVINNITVSPPEVNIQGDTTIVNVSLGDTVGAGDVVPDSIKNKMSVLGKYADSLAGGFSNFDSTSRGGGFLSEGALDSGAVGMEKAWREITSDTSAVSGLSDSMTAMFNNMDIMKIQGGSGSCPSALSKQTQFTIPHVGTITAPPLGHYLCTPVVGSISFWQIGRVVVRFVISVLCMFFLFDCATGNISNKGE